MSDARRKFLHIGRNVVEHPMRPGSSRGIRIIAIKAKLLVCSGESFHFSGTEKSEPSLVYSPRIAVIGFICPLLYKMLLTPRFVTPAEKNLQVACANMFVACANMQSAFACRSGSLPYIKVDIAHPAAVDCCLRVPPVLEFTVLSSAVISS
jgi:hypothetical protein